MTAKPSNVGVLLAAAVPCRDSRVLASRPLPQCWGSSQQVLRCTPCHGARRRLGVRPGRSPQRGISRLEPLIQLGETRFIVLASRSRLTASDVGESLIGLYACQRKGEPAFEREQVARVAHQLRDNLRGWQAQPPEGRQRRWAGPVGAVGSSTGLGTTCHGPDTRVATYTRAWRSSRSPAGARHGAAPP